MRPVTLHAYVDESHFAGPPSFYLLAAVLVDSDAAPDVRAALVGLLAGKDRVHWHVEGPARRLLLSAAVARLELRAAVVIGTPVDHRRQERARRQCLAQLIWQLGECRTERICLESRGPAGDGHDRRALDGFRAAGILRSGLYAEHAVPRREPILWASDVVAGATAEAERGDPGYLELLADVVRVHRFRPK